MKKILATLLCLTMAAPCFAAPNYRFDAPAPRHDYNMPPVEYRQPHVQRYVHHYEPVGCRPVSQRTKTLAAVAGVGIAAAVISAIVD